MHVVRRPPHRRSGCHSARFIRKGRLGARPIIGLLLVAGVTLAGVGVNVARAETPAHKIARLRSQAAEAQAAIDHMNDQVETVVEEFNANHEALQATLDRQRDTGRRLEDARKRLGGAESLMGDRMRAIYMGGPVTGLEQMLEVRSVADAITLAQYQESASDSDVQTIDAVRQRRRELDSVATDLNGQRREQEQLQARLDGQRRDIQSKLAQQRDYLARLGTDVKRAMAEEQQRQEELQRQALARKLAADKAREQAAREAAVAAQRDKAAKDAAARASASGGSGSGSGTSSGSGSGSGVSGSSASGGSGSGSGGSSSDSRHGSTGSLSSASSAPAPTSAASQAVAYAKAQLGKPYVERRGTQQLRLLGADDDGLAQRRGVDPAGGGRAVRHGEAHQPVLAGTGRPGVLRQPHPPRRDVRRRRHDDRGAPHGPGGPVPHDRPLRLRRRHAADRMTR